MRFLGLEIRRAREDDYAETYMNLRKAAVLAGEGGASATVEACVAAWERGFALLRCDNSPPYVDGAFFAACGRDLAEHGETTWLIEAGGLRRCVKADKIRGGGWDVVLAAASLYDAAEHRRVLGNEILHVAINCARERPWEGRSPAYMAADTVRLDSQLDAAHTAVMSNPGFGSVLLMGGYLPGDSARERVNEDFNVKLRDPKVRLVPGKIGAGDKLDWQKVEVTPKVSDATAQDLVMPTVARICAAYGLPPSMLNWQLGSAAMRESMRAFNFMTLAPISRLIEAEIKRTLAPDAVVHSNDFLSVDSQSRARAIKAYTDAGVDLRVALAMVGFHQTPPPAQDAGNA